VKNDDPACAEEHIPNTLFWSGSVEVVGHVGPSLDFAEPQCASGIGPSRR
jgi:hypothetical protein